MLNTEYSRKSIIASLMAMLLVLTLLVVMLPSAAAQAGPAMYAPPLTVTPTIDGIWSFGEWDDAPEYWITGPGGTSYVRVKHNGSHLFMIIDSPWDTTNASVYDSENLWVAFDTAHNRGSVPQTDDWLFDNPHSSKQVDMESWNGTGTGWSDPTFEPNATDYYAEGCTRVPWGGGGIGPQPSPHNATAHRIDEIMMPRQFVTTGNEAGLYILVVDDTDASKYVEWPSWAGGDSWGWPPFDDPCPAPNAWGTLLLQTKYGMYAPPLTVTPTIDGIWSSSEWDDAPQYTMSNSTGGNIGYIRAKFNNTHLCVLVDSPWDTTNKTIDIFWNENLWLAFDTAHDGGWGAPQSDDYLIHAMTDNTPPNGTGMGWIGNWTTWDFQPIGWWPYTTQTVRISQAGSNSTAGMIPLQYSPNDQSTLHRISEASIPLDLVGSPGSTVGFYVQLDDDSTDPDGANFTLAATAYSEWPPVAGGSPGWPGWWGSAPCPAPGAWGDLILSAPVGGTVLTVDKLSLLAPYIALVSMIAVAGTAAVYFIRRKKLR